MDEKEKEIQEALGLLKTFSGYVQSQGSIHYDIYEVYDVTLDGANIQLDKIVEAAQKKSKVSIKLAFIIDEDNEYDSGWFSSNIKS